MIDTYSFILALLFLLLSVNKEFNVSHKWCNMYICLFNDNTPKTGKIARHCFLDLLQCQHGNKSAIYRNQFLIAKYRKKFCEMFYHFSTKDKRPRSHENSFCIVIMITIEIVGLES